MTKMRNWRPGAAPLLLVASGLVAATATAMPQFGGWSAPASIETLPGSSTELNLPGAVDGCASQSRDGLMLAFNSSRDGGQEIFIATRSSKSEGFGDPVRLPAPVNSDAIEFCPTLLPGKRMIFSRSLPGDLGDLFETRLGPNGWSQPRNLGPNINSAQMDEAASVYEDENGNHVLVFSSRNGDGSGGKIYQSVNGAPSELVAGGPHSSASDNRPSVTHEGKTIVFDSTRSGGLGGPDLYYSTRSSTSQPWGPAIHLQALSAGSFDARASISWDGTMMTFSSIRPASPPNPPDMYFVTRSR